MIENKLNKENVSTSNTFYAKSNMSFYDKKELIVDEMQKKLSDVIK
jgi:hypothetical protein